MVPLTKQIYYSAVDRWKGDGGRGGGQHVRLLKTFYDAESNNMRGQQFSDAIESIFFEIFSGNNLLGSNAAFL